MPTAPDNSAESVGSLLKGARLERGLTVEQVAAELRVPVRALTFFEDDAHGCLANDAYTRIYLRAYAGYLGFESGTLLRQFQRERDRHVGARPRPAAASLRPTAKFGWFTPGLVRTALLSVAAVAVASYFGLELKRMVAPPTIVLSSPQDGLVTTDRTVAVEGRTEREITVLVNGKPISPDLKGEFRDSLELQDGTNVITVTGQKKHSQEVTLTRRVLVLPTEHPTAFLPADAASDTDKVPSRLPAAEKKTVASPKTAAVAQPKPTAQPPEETVPARYQASTAEVSPTAPLAD
jgi:hypothetical protein